MNKKKIKICETCANKTMLTKGGIMCDLNDEVVVDNYSPTDKYLWCNERMYEEEE